MPGERSFIGITVLLGMVAFVHALVTWPIAATIALFGGGAVLAFLGEAIAINGGWVRHHLGTTVLGVPLFVLFGWVGVAYIALRVALLVVRGVPAVLVAASLPTMYDVLTDHYGVEAGYWSYTDELPGPRYRGVPWWNYAGWFVLVGATTALAIPLR